MRQRRVIVGMDANEQFTPSPHSTGQQQAQGHTSRAEAILAWHQRVGLRLPPQDLAKPSHFPVCHHAKAQEAGLRLFEGLLLARRGGCRRSGTLQGRTTRRSHSDSELPHHPTAPTSQHVDLDTSLSVTKQTSSSCSMRQLNSRRGTDTPRLRSSAKQSPSQAGGTATSLLKAAPSKRADARRITSPRGRRGGRPGKPSTNNFTGSTKHGSNNLPKGPANTTGQHTDSRSATTTTKGTRGWPHSQTRMTGRGPC